MKNEKAAGHAKLVGRVDVGAPHVVLLGAGASLAALPNGDRHGRKLPLMQNFVEVLELGPMLEAHGIASTGNFEEMYGRLAADPGQTKLLNQLENRVYEYFDALELPEVPTLYDHLVLSLRRKDVIATFNWDPLLPQAYARCRTRTRRQLPSLFFLHGSVAAGYCVGHRDVVGRPGQACPRCSTPLARTRLLYPVVKKDYASDPFIAGEWEAVRAALDNAFAFTVFGYSAPTSDTEAKALLLQAWNGNRAREFVETEIIDIKPKAEIEQTWKPFFFSHHYSLCSNLVDSYIGYYPRRSCEALFAQKLEAQWVKAAPLPADASFTQLDAWLRPYLDAELTTSTK